MVSSTDAEKPFDKNLTSTHGIKKKVNKLGMRIDFFNLINGICEKPTVNIILNGETLAFPVRIETRQKSICDFY